MKIGISSTGCSPHVDFDINTCRGEAAHHTCAEEWLSLSIGHSYFHHRIALYLGRIGSSLEVGIFAPGYFNVVPVNGQQDEIIIGWMSRGGSSTVPGIVKYSSNPSIIVGGL